MEESNCFFRTSNMPEDVSGEELLVMLLADGLILRFHVTSRRAFRVIKSFQRLQGTSSRFKPETAEMIDVMPFGFLQNDHTLLEPVRSDTRLKKWKGNESFLFFYQGTVYSDCLFLSVVL